MTPTKITIFILGHIGITLAFFFFASLAISSISRILFANSVANGRLVAHTLVFVIVMFFVGYVLYRQRGDSRVIQIMGTCSLHLVEDRIWASPVTLLWPMMRWEFPEGTNYGSFLDYLLHITTLSYVPEFSYGFVAELFGWLVLGVILVRYWRTLQAY